MIIPLKLRLQLQDVKRWMTRKKPYNAELFPWIFLVTLQHRFFQGKVFWGSNCPIAKGPNVNLVSFPKWWLNSWHIFEPQTLEVTSHFWGCERVAACRPRPTTRCSVPMCGGATAVLQWRVDPSKTTQRRGLHVLDLEGGAFFCWGDCKGFRSSLGMKFEKPEPNL